MFDTNNRSGKSKKTITIRTDDPLNLHIQLHVSANLDLQLDTTPRRLWFGSLNGPEPVTRSCTFQGTRVDSVSITRIRPGDDVPENVYTWKLNDLRNSGEGLQLDVTFHAENAVPGRFVHQLIVETDLADTPELRVNLSGELTGFIYSTPPRLLFANYETGVPMQESVTIQTYRNVPFSVIAVESDDPEISVTIHGDQASLEQVLTVSFKPVEDRPRFQAKVKITTDIGSRSEMFLDVHGFQKRQPKKLSLRNKM